MWIAGVVVACAAVAQQSPMTEGLTPYQFTFRNDEPDLFAFVNEDDLQKISIPVVVDEPWNKRAYVTTVQKSFIAEMSPELSSMRKERLKREWREAGGVEIQDRSGDAYWVLKSDVDKQKRVDQMLATAFPKVVEGEPVNAASVGELQEGGAKGPGFLRLWGPHIAIAAGALALMAGALWFTFRRTWSPV